MSSAKKRAVEKKLSAGSFQSLQLSPPVFKAVTRLGFKIPTPVQRKTLPLALLGSDLVVMARTGSGKTAAFVVPIVERLGEHQRGGARGVILSPTRELALQTFKVCTSMCHFTDLRAVAIVGGDGMERQFESLSKDPDVIVATPGRLAHHLLEVPDFSLKTCEIVVFDEADRLFEMGFSQQIRDITNTMTSGRQTMLFSATLPKMLVEFARAGLNDPEMIRLDSEANVSEDLRMGFFNCRSDDKDAVLLYLLSSVLPEETSGLTIVFVSTRHHVEYVNTLLTAAHLNPVMIYGQMDLDTRKTNLHMFRTGKKPILIVTDVAARGIDVPQIDNVIHHSFPPSPKLFIHRSGRAARAGRVGYAFCLVEPDEVAYMVDLHVFLGRKLSLGFKNEKKEGEEDGEGQVMNVGDSDSDSDGEGDENNNHDGNGEGEQVRYSLDMMTTDDVHYGSVPESVINNEKENIRRLLSEESGNTDSETLWAQVRTCKNAEKQYKRSRPEASREGIKKGKELLAKFPIPPHPFLARIEEELMEVLREKGTVGSSQQVKERDDFLKAMASFRPKETIFEARATQGGSTQAGQVDKGRNTGTVMGGTKDIMKSMRREMKVVKNKGSLMVAGSKLANEENGDFTGLDDENDVDVDVDVDVDDENDNDDEYDIIPEALPKPPPQQKKRMSKAERKKLKKNGGIAVESLGVESSSSSSSSPAKSSKKSKNFRDPENYIDLERNFDQRAADVEAALQPSFGGGRDSKSSALAMENAMLDLVGDENKDMVSKTRIMRWDKSKRKYIQTTVGDEASGMTHAKKIRLESGRTVKGKNVKLGELYEKWQKKTGSSVGRSGVFDEVVDDGDSDGGGGDKKKKPMNPRWQTKEKLEAKKKYMETRQSEVKTAQAVKKKREQDAKNKLKNMKKSERRKIEKAKAGLGLGGKGKKGGGGGGGKGGGGFKKKR